MTDYEILVRRQRMSQLKKDLFWLGMVALGIGVLTWVSLTGSFQP
jgi:hypothetical protein